MELIKRSIDFDFLSKRNQAFYFSLILIGIGILSLIIHGGLNFGLDFTGGTQVQLFFDQQVDIGEIRNALSSLEFGDITIKEFGSPNEIEITTEQVTDISDSLISILSQSFPNNAIELHRTDLIGPRIGSELKIGALKSIIFALALLVIYITVRFEFKFAIGAIVALIHDVIITIGFFSVLDKEITLAIVAALLTIVGYSLNDTIVVSDRIRENLKVLRRETYNIIINRSLNQTLSRTIITSFTTLVVVIVFYILGSEIIKDFSLALIIGVSIGTYSSLFVATPLVVYIHERQESKKRMR